MHVRLHDRREAPTFRQASPASRPRGQSRWTTTLAYVRAHRGEFTYQDFGTPWGIVARNIDVVVEKPGADGNYRGTADFTDGLVAIQQYVPFRTDMKSRFEIDDGRIVFDRMELTTEGTRSELVGDVNMRYWPELMLQMKSSIDFPKQRELFFAGDTFSLTGKGAVHRHVPSVQGADAGRPAAHGPRAQGAVHRPTSSASIDTASTTCAATCAGRPRRSPSPTRASRLYGGERAIQLSHGAAQHQGRDADGELRDRLRGRGPDDAQRPLGVRRHPPRRPRRRAPICSSGRFVAIAITPAAAPCASRHPVNRC